MTEFSHVKYSSVALHYQLERWKVKCPTCLYGGCFANEDAPVWVLCLSSIPLTLCQVIHTR